MPKILKKSNKTSKKAIKDSSRIVNVKKTVNISLIITGILLFISLLLNGEIINIILDQFTIEQPLIDQPLILDIIDVSVKVSVLLLFFLLLIVSYSNYRELKGKPIGWLELVIISFLTLIQSFRNTWVFVFSLVGVVVLIIYLYLIQE